MMQLAFLFRSSSREHYFLRFRFGIALEAFLFR